MKIFNKISIITLTAVLAFSVVWLVKAATTVNLGTADNFAVLAGSGITNTGITTITGDVGTHPTVTETGFGSVNLTGTNHFGDAVTQQAKADLVTAYNNAAGQVVSSQVATELGGTTKIAGVYDSADGAFGITGTLTLDAQGDSNAIFIFKTASTLITASASQVNLINGAQACNVFWQVGSSATLGTTSDFKGNILALASITDNGGSTVIGRILARNAAVTLNNTTVARAICAGGAPATLRVIKSVVNDDSGLAIASDFNIYVKIAGVNVAGSPAFGSTTPGTLYSLSAGTYVVSEDLNSNYRQSFSGDCDSNGIVTLSAGNNKICTVINSDTPVIRGSGSAFYLPAAEPDSLLLLPILSPIINLEKIPSRLTPFPFGGGEVVYTYTVTNPGPVAMNGIVVTDDKCGQIYFIAGDINGNNLLEPTETWSYNCLTNISVSTRNIAMVQGQANGFTIQDYAVADVLVLVPGLPDAGFSSEGKNNSQNIIMLIGIGLVILSSIIIALKKPRA
jgi:hypothetical protein